MKRKMLLDLSMCSTKRFDNLSSRGQLPYIQKRLAGGISHDSEKGQKMAEYTLQEAFQLRVMLNLIDNQGLSIETARYIAGNCISKLLFAEDGYLCDPASQPWLICVLEKPVEGSQAGRMLHAVSMNKMALKIYDDVKSEHLAFAVLVDAKAISDQIFQKSEELGLLKGTGLERAEDGEFPMMIWAVEG